MPALKANPQVQKMADISIDSKATVAKFKEECECPRCCLEVMLIEQTCPNRMSVWARTMRKSLKGERRRRKAKMADRRRG